MVWYDPSLRLWTCQTLDGNGNQVGDVEYDTDRKEAMFWLQTGMWHHNTLGHNGTL